MKPLILILLFGTVVVSGEKWRCDVDMGVECLPEVTELRNTCRIDPVHWTCRKYKVLSEKVCPNDGTCFTGPNTYECCYNEEIISVFTRETKRVTKEEAMKLDKEVR